MAECTSNGSSCLIPRKTVEHVTLGTGKNEDGFISGCHNSHNFLFNNEHSTDLLTIKSQHYTRRGDRIRKAPIIFSVLYSAKEEADVKTLYDPGWKTIEELKAMAKKAFDNYKLTDDYKELHKSKSNKPRDWAGNVKVIDEDVPDFKGERYYYEYVVKFRGYCRKTAHNQDELITFWPVVINSKFRKKN